MIKGLKLMVIAQRLKRLKVTAQSNAQLRELKVVSNGQVMKVLDYIEKTAEKMPKIEVNGKPIDVERRMKELYYKHGLKGLNLYVDYIRLRTAIELKKRKK